jgi:hypothetical protein
MTVELESSGRLIWDAFGGDKLDPHSRALILELARCADTCDRLDGLAAGRVDSWAVLVFDDMGEIHLSIDKVLDLRLKHQLALRALYAEVRAAKIEFKSTGSKSKDEEPEDMLAKLRRDKERRERQSG